MKKVILVFSIVIGILFSQEAFAQNQCIALTKKGTQCKRKASEGSDYCFQHKKIAETNEVKTEEKEEKDVKEVREEKQKVKKEKNVSSGDTYNGRTIHTGPRGGKYYINKNGNKTYIKRK